MSESDEIVLYHSPASRSFAAYWMLEEIGRPFRVELTDISAGAQKRPEYLRLNPAGKVPALVDGDVVITERAAICTYLADRYAYGWLAPRLDAPERAAYLQWLFYSVGVMEPVLALRDLQLDTSARSGAWGDPWGEYETMVSVVSAQLEHNDFILGADFSAADVMVGSVVSIYLFCGLLPKTPELSGYRDCLHARPACERAMAATWPAAG